MVLSATAAEPRPHPFHQAPPEAQTEPRSGRYRAATVRERSSHNTL